MMLTSSTAMRSAPFCTKKPCRLTRSGGPMRARAAVVFALVVGGWLWLDARAQTNEPIVSGAHRFQKVADGVYYATSSGTMNVGANSLIIVTDAEALVIDCEIMPAAARALVADLRAIT